MRTVPLGIAGFLLLVGAVELQAQDRDTSSTRAQAFPKPVKAKATPVRDAAARARGGDAAAKGMLPPKTKSAPAPRRGDSLPAITKPPKTPPA